MSFWGSSSLGLSFPGSLVVPLTAVAGGAAVWALAQPYDREGEDVKAVDTAGDGARLAATLAENGALRERLNVSRDAQTDVQRQLAELRTQLQRLEAEANPPLIPSDCHD